MASTLRHKWLKKPSFLCQKALNFVHIEQYNLVHILPAYGQYVLNNVWRDFRRPASGFATVAQKSCNVKFTTKTDFSIGQFRLPLLTLTLEV